MDPFACLVVLFVEGLGWGQAPQFLMGARHLERVQSRLCGQVLDFTDNHGRDRRLWSNALCQKRDLYVYLPPGFDPRKKYPLAYYLHGAGQDEGFFLQGPVEPLDEAIVNGKLPPLIVAVPDGSYRGRASLFKPATFFLNSRMGRFEDYVMQDVWTFLHTNFPIQPERGAHAIMGGSMGGAAAYTLGIKNRDRFQVVFGLYPPLNLRWTDSQGRYRAPFHPDDWGYRERVRGLEKVGTHGMVTLRFRDLIVPAFGHGQQAMAQVAAINPLEMLDTYNVRPGELEMFVAYGGKDEFNIHAQVESFLWRAHGRGLEVTVAYDPDGKHDLATARRLMPYGLEWAAKRIPQPK
jgi:S-formylglutathione hydrolase FrmB